MPSVRRVSKTLVVTLAAFLLAAGLAACGGSSSSRTTEAVAPTEEKPAEGASQEPGQKEGAGGRSSVPRRSASSVEREAAEFAPKQHHDSGGGSTQFETKGGDNSVQEFGGEAGSSEREAAAAALHNFLDARAEQNWAAACQRLSAKVVESFEKLAEQAKQPEGISCAVLLEQLTNPAAMGSLKAEAREADVRSLRVEGERAFVIYTAGGTVFTIPMVKEGGKWKLATVAGTPIG